jgi:L-threonylcarbamoyladenylate synthase
VGELERALAALEARGTIVYPTETLYGLGVDATCEIALRRLATLKERELGKPIAVLVASRAMLDDIAAEVPPVAERLIARFWPGPLTLALHARPGVSAVLTGGGETVAARISAHPIAHALVTRLRRPLTSPSANPAGAAPPHEVGVARAYFGDRIDVYVDAGPLAAGAASTVIDCVGDAPRLVRQGRISAEDIEAVAGMRLCRE